MIRVRTLQSVSYTHLDVYKRQGAASPPTIVFHGTADTTVHPGNADHVLDAGEDLSVQVHPAHDDPRPVSYTHLDVYKRQEHYQGAAASKSRARADHSWRSASIGSSRAARRAGK